MFGNFFEKFGRNSDDEVRMEANLNQAKEILSKEDRNMEALVTDARSILKQAAEDQKSGKMEEAATEYQSAYESGSELGDDVSEEETKKLFEEMEKTIETMLNESNSFYTNVEKGSAGELFFQTVIEEIPGLGVSINKIARSPETGEILSNCVAIETVPYKTDKAFLFKLNNSPIINLLKFPLYHSEMGRELEQKGLLAKGTTDRALAKYYDVQRQLAIKNANTSNEYDAKFWKQDAAQLKEIISTLGAVPFSDDEMQELMRPIIRDAYREKLGI